MKKIYTKKLEEILVDNKDYAWLNHYKWHLNYKKYAICGIYCKDTQKTKLFRMHRMIMDAKADEQVDHINRNKLDNRRSNLRIVSGSQNARNIGLSKHNTSGFRWICWDKNRNKWYVSYKLNNKKYHVGRFNTIEEAKIAIDEVILPKMKDALL